MISAMDQGISVVPSVSSYTHCYYQDQHAPAYLKQSVAMNNADSTVYQYHAYIYVCNVPGCMASRLQLASYRFISHLDFHTENAVQSTPNKTCDSPMPN